MNIVALKHICERAQKADEIVIVGAGYRGKELLAYFEENSTITVSAFFDNNDMIVGERINDITIMKPYRILKKKVMYIIAVDAPTIQNELYNQLRTLGIDDNNIVFYSFREYDYLRNLDEKYYQDILQIMHCERIGRRINWQNPITYNEKINWEKLNIKDARRTKLADKLLVRDWIKEQIGEKYLTKLYDVWDDANDINFVALPSSFVLKLNNGSGRNIVVKDKSQINEVDIRKTLNRWKERNFAYSALELHYRDIVPKIICEEYLEGVAESVYDYNIYCFHGEPEYIWCIKGSHKPDCKASFYTKEWEMMPFSYGYPRDDVVAPRPSKLEEMIELSRILSKDFKHVRVDWYNLPDGRVLFGEMTFATWAGLRKWEPDEYDTIFGNMI